MIFRREKALKDSSVVSRAEGISSTESSEGVFLVDARGGRLYQLNPSGAAIWAGISTPIRVEELCRRVAAEFSVDSETIRPDVFALVSELYRVGLLHL